MAVVNTIPVEFDMLEYSFVRLTIEIQINEIKLKMLKASERERYGLNNQLVIFNGIKDKLFDAYESELRK